MQAQQLFAERRQLLPASGYSGSIHWSGEQVFPRTHPDYELWCWAVKQTRFDRLVDEKEIPAIRKQWEAERGG